MSNQITITLPDGTEIMSESGSTVYDIIGQIGKGLQKSAIAAQIDETMVDLSTTVKSNANLKVFTFDSPEGKSVFWHSASHLMAQAIKRLFHTALFAIGPSIENGFYYDIHLAHKLVPEDLELIEKEMAKIVEENTPITREVIKRKDAIELFEREGDIFKVEILQELDVEEVTLYRQGDFFDLCRGPHVISTGVIKAFKLMSIAGAYWRADESRQMLQRVYGIAFPDPKKLKKHLNMLEEAKKRDHRKLGKELDLFSTHEEAGAGLVYWHPKGARMRTILEDWWRKEHFKNGYEVLYTPHVGKANLWETSGHLDFYADGMFAPMVVDDNDYYVKPMNCPFHIKIFQSNLHSYRDLPLRWAELGTVYRYEKSGVLHGLLRVRGFTQDDAHIFCTPDQIELEIREILRFSMSVWKTLGFTEIKAYLATKPEKAVGEDEKWEKAQESLMNAVNAENLDIEVDEGGGAFYGPKIDLKVRDSIGREWQMSTIQFDFNLPERFDMTYIGEDGKKHRPYMVHRALLGSLERFFGILIEHYAGKFPLWFAPVQVVLMNVNDTQLDYVNELKRKMVAEEMRITTDLRDESISYKIRDAVTHKAPYVCVIGDKEVEEGTISVRKRGEKKSTTINFDDFMDMLRLEIKEKR